MVYNALILQKLEGLVSLDFSFLPLLAAFFGVKWVCVVCKLILVIKETKLFTAQI